jgi:hypothetical protein
MPGGLSRSWSSPAIRSCAASRSRSSRR